MASWIAVVTKPHQERRAAHHVERQGHRFYLPMMTETFSRRDGSLGERRVVLFQGYLLVRIVRGQWSHLLSTRGISRVVMSGEKPGTIAVAEIDRIRATEVGGYVVLAPRPQRFRHGQPVLVTSGLLEDRTVVYQGQSAPERAQVLFNLLGVDKTIEVQESSLEAA